MSGINRPDVYIPIESDRRPRIDPVEGDDRAAIRPPDSDWVSIQPNDEISIQPNDEIGILPDELVTTPIHNPMDTQPVRGTLDYLRSFHPEVYDQLIRDFAEKVLSDCRKAQVKIKKAMKGLP